MQHNLKSSSYRKGVSRRSGSYALKAIEFTPGGPVAKAVGKSAEGIVDGLSGEANEALQSRKAETTDRHSRKATIEGLKSVPAEWRNKW